MTEYVYRPLRNGKRARLYCGRYTLARGERPQTVYLGTPDKTVARKRLRDIIIEAQREAEGILAPKSQREAAIAPLSELLADYVADLRALGRDPQYIHDTEQRISRILRETGWTRLKDIRADQFVKWRATLKIAAKTVKDYQAAIVAWLNWLARINRIAVNPLGKLATVETRGKQVRLARAFTAEELLRLFAASPKRCLIYQTMTYTGQRRGEVRSLVWGDLHLDEVQPYALFRVEEMKDKDKRAIPLHPRLAVALRAAKPVNAKPETPVFTFFPHHKTLMADLKRAGIERRDALGRVVHFHSFRKTFQTLGVKHGINQRAAQELLGHSDANLTAKVYTDVPAIGLHGEVAKLPWIEQGTDAALVCIPKSVRPAVASRFSQLCRELLSLSEAVEKSEVSELLGLSKMVDPTGLEPTGSASESVERQIPAKAARLVAAAIRTLFEEDEAR